MASGVAALAQDQPVPGAAMTSALPCGSGAAVRARAGSVLDGGNFSLEDGRTVHLAGIEIPLLPAADATPGASGAAARAVLAALLSGADIDLWQSEAKSDRYGRIVAYADAVQEASRRSVQAELVAAGVARVGADVASEACAAELLRRETTARKGKFGLWADDSYEPLQADDSAAILRRRGHFALIEGKVMSVHESGATVYVNFGRRWSEDFAVTIRKRNEHSFTAAGLAPGSLNGRRVLVRGWIEARDGSSNGQGFWRAPWIEAEHPSQIEPGGPD